MNLNKGLSDECKRRIHFGIASNVLIKGTKGEDYCTNFKGVRI